MRRAACTALRTLPSVSLHCLARSTRTPYGPRREISAPVAMCSRPAPRCQFRQYTTESKRGPQESTEKVEPKHLLFDFTPKSAPAANAEEGAIEEHEGAQKKTGGAAHDGTAWPPKPEEEQITITFTSPWVAAVLVLLVICAVELYTLDSVVKPEGERKMLAKIEERRADARAEPSSISLLETLNKPSSPT